MSKKILYEGPDISYHNGSVDMKQIRDAGCGCVGIRAGYGKNNIDKKYAGNALACHNLGMAVLLYWFSYAYTTAMAVAEAGYAVAQAAKYWRSCPIAFDFEYDSVKYARKNGVTITKALATDMAIAFLLQVKAAGYIPVIYTNRDYLRNYFDMDRINAEIGRVYVWYARYTSALPAGEADIPDIWQYTSKGRIPGVNGNVDLNRFYTDFADSTIKVEDGTDGSRTVDELAQEVRDGLWGDGAERKRRLTMAGYDYDAVQARVNKIYETHTVVRGDTLSGIARQYNTSVSVLVQLNRIADPNRIYVGQVIRVI